LPPRTKTDPPASSRSGSTTVAFLSNTFFEEMFFIALQTDARIAVDRNAGTVK
jgi:hypothetical protein